MKALKVWACVAVLAACGMVTWQAVAQETPTKAVAKKESRGRLPAQYGKLGISDEVKDELYQIDEEYDVKIDALTAQIKELQAERESKMQEKLTDAQRAQLKELRDEAAAKRKSNTEKSKTESVPKSGTEAPATPTTPATPATPKKGV